MPPTGEPSLVESVGPETNLVYTETQRLWFALEALGRLKLQLFQETNADNTAQRSVRLPSSSVLHSLTYQSMFKFITINQEPFCPQQSKGWTNPFVVAAGRPSEGELPLL